MKRTSTDKSPAWTAVLERAKAALDRPVTAPMIHIAEMTRNNEMDANQKLAGLSAHFPPEMISFRVGPMTQDKKKGIALAYIDARDVQKRLDDVIGPAGWQCEYIPMINGTTCCRLGIKIGNEWIWKSNGGANMTDKNDADSKEMAIKGDYSDAFKRAASTWGIGRYLYDYENIWVELEGKQIAKKEMTKLRAALTRMANAAVASAPDVHKEGPTIAKVTPLKKDIKLSFEALKKDMNDHLQDVGELKAWGVDNAAAIAKLDEGHQDALRALYHQNMLEVRALTFGGNIAGALAAHPEHDQDGVVVQ